ncbi:uncharacterized protein LOC127778411 isoform X2 [Oryza glaberrima]|uniref:uncharacterized protein LOC127778411 isoform X2 n=1 Tax=Oryza glaberrima TaxID=4538 RepID=UPI00224C428C|nr:uncharacterized protein LOC127778411 isoform X2 [Oryza glaberrima]
MGIESAPDDPRRQHPAVSIPEDETTSEAAAMSAAEERKRLALKEFWEEERRTSRERMLVFAERGEAYKKHGAHPMLPPFEITHLPDLLERAWGWDRILPYYPGSRSWPQYKAYLHEYYRRNGDDDNDLAALADLCIKGENELMYLLNRRPQIFKADEITLSKKITNCAYQMVSMECSEFPAATVALKCITKEADLMCQSVVSGAATTSSMVTSNSIRRCALRFMTYKGPEHVPATATMMAIMKESELLRNNLLGKADTFDWSFSVRNGGLSAMYKIYLELPTEEELRSGSTIGESVVNESDDRHCSENDIGKNNNLQEIEKINQGIILQETEGIIQETKEDVVKVDNLDESKEHEVKEDGVKRHNLDESLKQKTEEVGNGVNHTIHGKKLQEFLIITDEYDERTLLLSPLEKKKVSGKEDENVANPQKFLLACHGIGR